MLQEGSFKPLHLKSYFLHSLWYSSRLWEWCPYRMNFSLSKDVVVVLNKGKWKKMLSVFHYFIFCGLWPYLSGFLQHFFPSSHMRFYLKRQNTSICKTPTRVCLLCQSLFLTFPWINCSGKQSCLASVQCHSWAAGGHNSLPSIREGKKFQLSSTQATLRHIWLKEACAAWPIAKRSPQRREGGKEMEMRNQTGKVLILNSSS